MTLLSTPPRAFHRKFIAAILALSVAVTGVSIGATPARADGEDLAKILAGVAVLGIIGAAIKDHKDRKDDRKREHRDYPHYDRNRDTYPRPLPPQVRRYDLPAECLTSVGHRGRDGHLLEMRCLRRNYSFSRDLPRACYAETDRRRNHEHRAGEGYRVDCLRQYGYRLVRR